MTSLTSFANRIKIKSLSIYYLFFLLSINSIVCNDCKNEKSLLETKCYNDVIKFDHDTWRAGHACTNNNGDMIVEFSLNPQYSSKRLFYGLKKNGRYYFPGEPVYKQIDNITCQDGENNGYKGRFESRNLFVSLKNDLPKNKQYLFSMSSFCSLVELLDMDNGDDINYFAWNTLTFFDLNCHIFSFEFSLFEIGQTNSYI